MPEFSYCLRHVTLPGVKWRTLVSVLGVWYHKVFIYTRLGGLERQVKMGIVYNPVVIDPTADNLLVGLLSMQSNNVGGCAQMQTPIVYNGFLYWIGQRVNGVVNTTIQVWRAPLDGSVWTLIDGAASPAMNVSALTAGAFYDGVDTITVAYITASPTVKGPIILQTFDLVTETWGATFGAGAPVVSFVDSVWIRSDSTVVVLHSRVQLPGSSGLAASVWNGAAWTTFAVDTNASNVSNTSASAVLDPATDVIHVFMRTAGQTCTYQQFDITNTLGSFTNFSAAQIGCSRWQYTNPIIVGNFILFGPLDPSETVPVLLSGTPLTAPVFSISPTIDPEGSGSPLSFTSLAFTGSAIVGIYVPDDNTSLRFVYTENLTSPGEDWTGQPLQGTSDPTNFNIQFNQIGVLSGDPYGQLFAQFEQSFNYVASRPNIVGGILDFAPPSSTRVIDANMLAIIPLLFDPAKGNC